jgi:hypothetical protein
MTVDMFIGICVVSAIGALFLKSIGEKIAFGVKNYIIIKELSIVSEIPYEEVKKAKKEFDKKINQMAKDGATTDEILEEYDSFFNKFGFYKTAEA